MTRPLVSITWPVGDGLTVGALLRFADELRAAGAPSRAYVAGGPKQGYLSCGWSRQRLTKGDAVSHETKTDVQSVQDGLEDLVEQGLLERGDAPGTYRTTKSGRDAVEAGFAKRPYAPERPPGQRGAGLSGVGPRNRGNR